MKTFKPAAIAAAAALAVAGLAGAQVNSQAGRADVERLVLQAGYTDIRDVEFDDGLWEAEATGGDGRSVDLVIDPSSGRVTDANAPAPVTMDAVAATLRSHGYDQVRDIEFDDGRWEAEAQNAEGHWVDVKLDAQGQRVIVENED